MHIPDGFLSLPTIGVTYAASAGAITYAVKQANKKLGDRHVPFMGVMAAFIFAAQMLNFPVAGGTSGHLLGAALAAILLGPWAAVLIMTCVLIVQAFVFQDGGITALGANIFNMGVVGGFVGYYIYRGVSLLAGKHPRGWLIAGFVASWASVLAASVAAALELGFSGIIPLRIALPAMTVVHALIGIGEGLITSAVLSLVMVARRDLMELTKV